MTSILAHRMQVPRGARAALLQQVALVAGGGALAGAGLALPLAGAGLPYAAGLLLGITLVVRGAAGIRRTWSTLDAVLAEISTAASNGLVPLDSRLAADSAFAPLAQTLTDVGAGVRQLVMQLQMQADQVRDI